MINGTAKLLSEITDEGFFERLATSILREAEPLYRSLVHPGVNADGKTVKAPLDGITYVVGGQPAHLIAVHHTTTRLSDLKSKWLHDPSTVRPRRQGRRPTAPPGDLLKTAKIVAAERSQSPGLIATLVLTTNQEPSIETVIDLHNAAKEYGVTIDLWPRSRLAHFLDKPEGQWLRAAFLGVAPEHLSRELLGTLSRDSAEIFRPADNRSDVWVDRALDRMIDEVRHDISFIVADSGSGKSVACYKKLAKHIDQGGFGLFLSHHIVEAALNLDQAVDLAIRQLQPQLAPNVGSEAMLLCSPANPLLIVVEDINRSGRASFLLEKLANWSERSSNNPKDLRSSKSWQVFCPVWPEVLLSLPDQPRKRVEALSISCPPLTETESRDAVKRRAAFEGLLLSDMDCDAIASALGHDPLLIALHDPNEAPNAHRVVSEFITASVTRAAYKNSEFSAPDYQGCLLTLSQEMLTRRELEPSWKDIIAWFGISNTVTNMLRRLLDHGEVLRLTTGTSDARVRFRHDRVREAILSSGVVAMVHSGSVGKSFLSDPFFAEVIGDALVDPTIPASFFDEAERANPLALFCALRRIGAQRSRNYTLILAALNSWLDRTDPSDSSQKHMRWQALWILAQTDSPDVIALTKRFRSRGWSSWLARLRNGDVGGGVEFCQEMDPGSTALWRDVQIDHAKMRFGAILSSDLKTILQTVDLAPTTRVGALRLAGHLAYPELADAISEAWRLDSERARHLEDYLWAGAQCCGDNPAKLLGPVCDAWAELPDKEEASNRPSARDDMASHSVKFAFRRSPPVCAIDYLIQRAETPELNWPILYLLHEVDNPRAVTFVAYGLAGIRKLVEEKGGFSPFLLSASDRWSRERRRGLPPMSAESKSSLFALWNERSADKHLREQAFIFWAASETEGDLTALRRISADDPIYDRALFQRLRRGDHQAIPFLLAKLHDEREDYWWQVGRYLWSDQMTEALDESLTRRGRSAKRDWEKPEQGADWINSENMLRLPPETAERLLVKHWDHLRFVPNFIQAALHTATPQLRSLVEEVMLECPDPKHLMEYIDQHYNINFGSGAGVTRLAQVESLIPYFALFSNVAIDHFWNHCNERGWFEFRKQHLDPLISSTRYTELLGGKHIPKALDEFLEKDKLHWVDLYLDRLFKAGVSHEELMGELARWFEERKTIGALRVVSNALIKIGRRSDLSILSSVTIEPGEVAAANIANTIFAVMRRTLQ